MYLKSWYRKFTESIELGRYSNFSGRQIENTEFQKQLKGRNLATICNGHTSGKRCFSDNQTFSIMHYDMDQAYHELKGELKPPWLL